jgi:hypothetical protein
MARQSQNKFSRWRKAAVWARHWLQLSRISCSLQACRNVLRPERFVSITLGLLLLTAAALKGLQSLSDGRADTLPRTPEWLTAVVIPAEIFIGLWLLSGLWPRWSWVSGLVTFSAFAWYSLFAGLSGRASCGCFGSGAVSPWTTLAVDLLAVAALVRWRPGHRPMYTQPSSQFVPAPRRYVAMATVMPCLAMGLVAGWTISSGPRATLGKFTSSEMMVLEPDQWNGQRLPILEHIDLGKQLTRGAWKVVLFHHDCPKCRETVAKYGSVGTVLDATGQSRRVMLVEIPPYGWHAEHPRTTASGVVHAQLSSTNEWFVTTPTEIEIDDGVVVTVSQ